MFRHLAVVIVSVGFLSGVGGNPPAMAQSNPTPPTCWQIVAGTCSDLALESCSESRCFEFPDFSDPFNPGTTYVCPSIQTDPDNPLDPLARETRIQGGLANAIIHHLEPTPMGQSGFSQFSVHEEVDCLEYRLCGSGNCIMNQDPSSPNFGKMVCPDGSSGWGVAEPSRTLVGYGVCFEWL